jgi:cytochrome c oxidase cbb3-type subunit 3
MPSRSARLLLGLALATGLSACSNQSAWSRIGQSSADAIWAKPDLRQDAIALGQPLFARHCASCHGQDLKGLASAHTPDLTDDRWLFGGEDIDTFVMRASDVERTILHGIRAKDPKTRDWPIMPARGVGHSLEPDEMAAATEYVLKLSGQPYDKAQIALGKETFEGEGGCYDCHTVQGWGDTATGAADLTRPKTWLYGRDRAAIAETIALGRSASSPAFSGKLKPEEARVLAVYVLSKAKSLKYN